MGYTVFDSIPFYLIDHSEPMKRRLGSSTNRTQKSKHMNNNKKTTVNHRGNTEL